jgi:hypothetical protein
MEDQEPKKEPKIVKTTLGELGPQLPIGIPDKTGALQRALAVRKWRLPEEREIGALRAKHKHKNVSRPYWRRCAPNLDHTGSTDHRKIRSGC